MPLALPADLQVLINTGRSLIQDPPIARFFFQSAAAAWLWLILRVWVGWQWLQAGEHKFTDPE